MYYIYALVDPRDNQDRYIGRTSNPKIRYRRHCRNTSGITHKENWLRLLKRLDLQPIMVILYQTEYYEESLRAEIEHILWRNQSGYDLVNSTEGGEGVLNPCDETREKMSKAHKNRSDSHRMSISSRWKGNKFACGKRTEEYKQRRRGERNPNSKLTSLDVINIKNMLLSGETCTSISKIYGVNRITISDIKNERTWSYINVKPS